MLYRASSTSVYGLPERVPIAETDRTSLLDPHARAKLQSERIVRRAARAFGITATILRYATVYGPGETPAGLVESFVRAAIDQAPPEIDGDGLEEDDYVHVDNVVEATLRAIEQRPDTTYNVGTGIGTSNLTLARAVFQLLDVDIEPVFRPPLRAQPYADRVLDGTRSERARLHRVAESAPGDPRSDRAGAPRQEARHAAVLTTSQ